ncbi:DUF938 domain-containing protein [Cypionkella sp.]|jgi:SAM-dependent methyltransferase|uniref:DUF938 domain-containing protein n=1 Tax=Cypionkella sp. TaxID=2811411 RepID=UPI0037527855
MTTPETLPDGRRQPAAAQRNAAPILQLLQGQNLHGPLLEIASGSGLHAAHFAAALPQVIWQPTDLEPQNLASITAWTQALPNVLPAQTLDACAPGWHRRFASQNAVLLVNLLHLISHPAAKILLAEAAACLAPKGRCFFYGPFLRNGQTTSAGDADFDATLRAQDPAIGYKDLAWVTARLTEAGLACQITAMPANNLMLIASHIQ